MKNMFNTRISRQKCQNPFPIKKSNIQLKIFCNTVTTDKGSALILNIDRLFISDY